LRRPPTAAEIWPPAQCILTISGGDAECKRGPLPGRIVFAYGFCIFLPSDIAMLAALFVVLMRATAGGPSARRCAAENLGCLS
jgi:hypothetical protein